MWEITGKDFMNRACLSLDNIKEAWDIYLDLWGYDHNKILLKGTQFEITIEDFNEKVLVPTIQNFYIPNFKLVEFRNNLDESSNFRIHKVLSLGSECTESDHDRDFHKENPVEFMEYIIKKSKKYAYIPFQKSVYGWDVPEGIDWRGIKTKSGFEIMLMELFAYIYKIDKVEFKPPHKVSLSPIRVIEQRMIELNLTRKDLEKSIGTRARVSEILSGKRTLTIEMIKNLSEQLNISADYLLG